MLQTCLVVLRITCLIPRDLLRLRLTWNIFLSLLFPTQKSFLSSTVLESEKEWSLFLISYYPMYFRHLCVTSFSLLIYFSLHRNSLISLVLKGGKSLSIIVTIVDYVFSFFIFSVLLFPLLPSSAFSLLDISLPPSPPPPNQSILPIQLSSPH